MHKSIMTLGSSILLSSLLLIGCGGDSSTSTQSVQEKFVPPAYVVEFDKEKSIREYLNTQGVMMKGSSYSQDKAYIYIVGIDKAQFTFYKFDAQTLSLMETTPISVMGTVDMGMEKDGKVSIVTIAEGTQNSYTFDTKEKKLLLKKQEPALTPKQLIQKQVGSGYLVDNVILTPSKMGALALVFDKEKKNFTLWLYGMENPKSPAREYAIHIAQEGEQFKNISKLGKGIISFDVLNYKEITNKKKSVTYDYFNKKMLKETWEGISGEIDMEALKEKLLKRDFDNNANISLYLTPSKLGLFVLKTGEEKWLFLYGLEDLENPKRERTFFQYSNSYAKKLEIKEILPNGIIVLKVGDDKSEMTVTFDYFHNKYVKFDTSATGEEKVKAVINAVKLFDNFRFVPNIKYLERLEGNKYIASYEYLMGDFMDRTSIFDISDGSENVLVQSYHFGGPYAENIMIDKEKSIISFMTRGISYVLPSSKSFIDYDEGGTIQYHYHYNYKKEMFFMRQEDKDIVAKEKAIMDKLSAAYEKRKKEGEKLGDKPTVKLHYKIDVENYVATISIGRREDNTILSGIFNINKLKYEDMVSYLEYNYNQRSSKSPKDIFGVYYGSSDYLVSHGDGDHEGSHGEKVQFYSYKDGILKYRLMSYLEDLSWIDREVVSYDVSQRKVVGGIDFVLLKSKIIKDLGSPVYEMHISPSKLNLIVRPVYSGGLVLYGLEDIQNPKRERKIKVPEGYVVSKVNSISSGGIVYYVLSAINSKQTLNIKYDYVHDKILSK